ncbi:Protocadherin-8 [Schistosoma japonicum]|uniref:Protocadherin-8 n=1 Tax=Schistosoma japonicum TaxID=6182 RepID=A0A4Z2DGB9_SCHJA|nr:Protocadherin-8 [Schistosoma japonicum]
MLSIVYLLKCNFYLSYQQYYLLIIILLFYINLIQSKTIRIQIDEEIQLNTKIGSLLKYIHGGLNNLYFIKINNSNDASRLFSVNELSDSILNQFTSTNCELYFSVNCINTTSYLNISYPYKIRTHISNKLIAIFDVIIELKDINDNGCKFIPSNQQIIHIREDSPVNDTRFTLNTPYDPDDMISGNTVKSDRIWIDTNSNQHIHSLFKLNSQLLLKNTTTSNINLELELIHPLDYEKEKIYSFQIVADDGFSSSEHECRLNITVLVEDCNDHLPLFEQSIYSVKISEDTPIGHLIIQLKANDADDGENGKIIYSFASYSDDIDDGNFFYINSETGEIKLQRRLNHRKKPRHLLKVVSKNPDNNTLRQMKPFHTSKLSTTQVIVNVIDVNDHFPRIRIISPTGSNNLELVEETPPGQDIGIVDVSDGDSGINAQVNCKLTNQTISEVLQLISIDNEIRDQDILNSNQKYKLTLQKRIDREEFPFIEFTIVCWDNGTPSLSSNLTHKIKVFDVNDHDPVCDQSIYSIEVMEDSSPDRVNKNFEFLTIHATDKDEGRNAKLRFSLDQETPSYIMNLIKVNSTTGTLSSLGNFDYEKINEFNVTLICSDHGELERMTKVRINIKILDNNDNPPTFSQPYFEFTIMENNHLSQLIGIFQITDNDIGKNAELIVQIEENIKQTHVYLTSLNNNIRIHNDIKELKESSYYEVKLYIESIIDREGLIMKYKDLVSDTLSHYGGYEYMNNNYYYDNRMSELTSITNYSIITPIILLLVSAHDKGIPQLTEYASIRIHILDENDNSPYFVYPDPTYVNRTRNFVSYNEPPGYAFTQLQLKSDGH